MLVVKARICCFCCWRWCGRGCACERARRAAGAGAARVGGGPGAALSITRNAQSPPSTCGRTPASPPALAHGDGPLAALAGRHGSWPAQGCRVVSCGRVGVRQGEAQVCERAGRRGLSEAAAERGGRGGGREAGAHPNWRENKDLQVIRRGGGGTCIPHCTPSQGAWGGGGVRAGGGGGRRRDVRGKTVHTPQIWGGEGCKAQEKGGLVMNRRLAWREGSFVQLSTGR